MDGTERPDPDEVPGEVGRQNERTTLAWRRTNLSALGVALLAAKASGSTPAALLIIASAFGASAVVGLLADRRTTRRADAIAHWDATLGGAALVAAAPVAVAAATGLTLALAATGLLIVVLS